MSDLLAHGRDVFKGTNGISHAVLFASYFIYEIIFCFLFKGIYFYWSVFTSKDRLWFSAGSWLVLHGVVSLQTGRGMFTSVRSQDLETAVTNSTFKVKLPVLLLNSCPSNQTLAMSLK